VYTLVALRQLLTVEEVTLMALSQTREAAAGDRACENLDAAQEARAARLHELRTAAACLVAIGTYYQVRARSTLATYAGISLALLGIVLIIASFAHGS
jgi:hypothetical protein